MRRATLGSIMLMAERKDSLRKARERRRRMSVEDNKTLARRSWEVTDNLDLLDEVYAADFVWHEPDQDIQGSEEDRVQRHQHTPHRRRQDSRGVEWLRYSGRDAADRRCPLTGAELVSSNLV